MKTEWRQLVTLLAKDIRAFVNAHPGSTKDQIYAAFPDRMGFGDAYDMLRRNHMVRYEGGGKKGPAKWFPITHA